MKSSSASKEEGSIFSNMAQLPMLKGVSQARLQEIAGSMRLNFSKFAAGDTVIEKGSVCDSLMFVLSGMVRLETSYADGEATSFTFGQTLGARQVIMPEHLFGLSTVYPCRVSAITDISVMEISKEDFRRMLALDPVFLFNYLNTVCARAQRSQTGLLAIAGGSAAERMAYWITTLSQPDATDIELHTGNRELHQMLGVSSAALRAAVGKLGGMVELVDSSTLRAPARTPLCDFLLRSVQ